MMRCEYSINVVVPLHCCSEVGCNDIGMPFDCFDLVDNAHSDVSSLTEVEVARAIVEDPYIIEESLRKKAFHKEMSFWI